MYELYVCESTESVCMDAQCAVARSDLVASGAEYFCHSLPIQNEILKGEN